MTAGVDRAMAAATVLTMASLGAAQTFTPGNLVVVQVGDGSGVLTEAAAAVYLKEIRPSDGAVVRTIPLPVAAGGAQRALTLSGTHTEGFVRRSADGRFLTLAGYDAPVGTPAVHATSAAIVQRVIGRVSSNGAVDTSTALAAFNGNSIRSAVTSDGSGFWAAGQSSPSGTGGVHYVPFGGGVGGASTQVLSEVNNCRSVAIAQGQLFVSVTVSGYYGVSAVGSGLPVEGGQSAGLLPGMPGVTGPSYQDFFFADATTLYLADDRDLSSGGGVQKWVYNGTAWVCPYTLSLGLTRGVRGLAGERSGGGVVTLYATTADSASSGTRLWRLVDTGGDAVFSLVAVAPSHAPWRDVELAPAEGGTTPGCYANCDGSTTPPVLNVADFSCFLQEFAQGSSYANCDGSSTPPVLNVADFSCFLQGFAAGCANP